MGKKRTAIAEIFKICSERNDYVFDNDLVKDVCGKVKFKNLFDVTKLDNDTLLPTILKENDYAVIHLGKGLHQFIKGIDKVYHSFEPIQTVIEWSYRRSILNEYNTSESNILSVANNQRILHHFLFGEDKEFDNADISKRPKTYFPHRTKTNLEYFFGKGTKISLTKMQIEIDLTIEYQGIIAIFEAKNGMPKNFSIYQLYHPFLYYYHAKQLPKMSDKVKEIIGVYVVRRVKNGTSLISLWAYTFTDPFDITSIKLLKSAQYNLQQEEIK